MAEVLGAAVGDPVFEKEHGGSRRYDNNAFGNKETKEREEDDYKDLVQSAVESAHSKGETSAHGASTADESIAITTSGGGSKRTNLLERALETKDPNNERLLKKIRERLDRVGIPLKTIEVRFDDLYIEADVRVGKRALPTLLNSVRNVIEDFLGELRILPQRKETLPILQNVSGILKPGRMTLLLGPPSSGKSVLLRALAGKSDSALRITGDITYNGHTFKEFIVQRTAAYVDQVDNHIGELTVRETFDFAGRCQGAAFSNDVLSEMQRKEKEMGIEPDPDIDEFLKASAAKSSMNNVMTDYIIKILGLDICAETVVGNEMLRGISGGQKKRVTTGEMIVGPKRALFMDEISTGLDSSTTFQITTCLRNFTHHMDATVLIALLQPAPETYDLFDDIMLLAEGHIVYHGPRERVLEFFERVGFRCPERKGVADFLQEVVSRKDQRQYWAKSTPYKFLTANELSVAFSSFSLGADRSRELEIPFDKTKSLPDALVKNKFALNIKEVLDVMYWREMILLKRMKFLYVFILFQVSYLGFAVATTFLRTRLGTKSIADGNLYLAVIFFSLINVMFSGFSEMAIIIQRLGVFFKQRDNYFYPAWSFAAPTWILRIPNSLMESTVSVLIVYYSTGLTPQAGRFFTFWLILLVVHQMSLGMFRLISAICRTMTIANTFGSFMLLVIFVLGGFILSKPEIPVYWIWGFWISPLAYAQNSAAINEFTAKRWHRPIFNDGKNTTVGDAVLTSRGLFTEYKWVWIGVGAIMGFSVVFNFLVVIALTLFNAIGNPQAVIPEDVMAEKKEARRERSAGSSAATSRANSFVGQRDVAGGARSVRQTEPAQPAIAEETASSAKNGGVNLPGSDVERAEEKREKWEEFLQTTRAGDVSQGVMEMGEDEEHVATREELAKAEVMPDASLFQKQGGEAPKRGMILPFTPLSMSFHHLWYYVPLPEGNEEFGIEKGGKLPLLRDVSGAFRPGVLTALVGVSGAGKTTLMDVLAGRKTAGEIQGDIWVANHPKEQHSFARISGYCEQFDTHSPCTTVREALIFSAWLRLPPEVDEDTRKVFVDEVMDLTELTPLRNALVGLPGINGLSVEQRKRLTIAVELVANPSIIFMDEPTSGLDARAAAVVMRAVRNTVDTGRTVVCTIHQPSIDIFESFDELLLMKRGGQIIFNGLLGQNSCELIKYFEAIEGVPSCPEGYNPATWMLEISTQSMERSLQVDFADHYMKSPLHKALTELVERLSQPSTDSKALAFDTQRSRNEWTQYRALLWKNNRSYWRNPTYNTVRFVFTVAIALVFGSVFFNQGLKRNTPQSLFNIMGALYAATLFQGFSNTNAVQPVFAIERTVMYRERAAGMYSAMPFAAAAVTIEIPYILMQAIWYSIIVYSLIQFEWTAAKFLWFFLYMFLTLVVFTMYGMMMVSLTPNAQVGAVVSSLFMGLWNLFSGFLIPAPRIPGWWIWMYYINPLAWVLYGMIVSQLGNVKSLIEVDNETKEVRKYVEDFFGFKHELVWLPAVVLTLMLGLFVVVTAHATRKFNFQKR